MSLKTKVKILQRVFEDKDFIYELVQNSKYLNNDLASIFSYYLCTEDKNKNYTMSEIISKLTELKTSGKNIIEERYYFQAYNGGSDKSYKKNGLDDISSIPKNVIEAFTFLENELGKTDKILGGHDGEHNRSFITGDPELVMRYALEYAPERLWAGPLCETGRYYRPLKTPIKIGESKSQYMMRIIANKVEQLDVSSEKKEELLKYGKIVSEFYGSKRPRIAIIPEHMIKDKRASFGRNPDKTTLGELAEREQGMWKKTLESGPNFAYESGVVIFDKILPNQFRSISIPDKFELMQIKAIQRGAEIGDLINPYTGELEERRKNVELDVVRHKNPFLEFIHKVIEKKSIPKKIYKNNGRIDLGGTGQMYLCTDDQNKEYYLNGGSIDEKIVRQFMREFVVDYCLCNYDSHYKNFIIDKNGNLRGIDKEQSLRYLVNDEGIKSRGRGIYEGFWKNDNFMNENPNEVYGEQPPIYGKIFGDIKNGKIPSSVLQELRVAIQSLESIPANVYLDMFTPYIQSLNLDKKSEINIYNKIMDRRQSLKTEVLSKVNTIDTSMNEKRKKVQGLSKILSKLRHTLDETRVCQKEKGIDIEH